MKRHILTIILATSLVAGCSKSFTDLSPVSQRNVDAFYKTSGDMVTAINATYKALQLPGAYNQGYWIAGELRSDNTDAGNDVSGGLGIDLNVVDNFKEDETSEVVSAIYFDSYVGISRANIVLSRIDAVPMDETLKNRIKGEALFLRSLFYYHLAIDFGRIPFVLKEIAVEEGKSYPQVPATEVYKQLITDLVQAEGYLAQRYTGSDLGRATKGAAATLLAKIYLTTGDKTSALPVLRRIVNTYGYTLLPDYARLWGIVNENNAESIFEVQFKGGGTNTGNSFTNAFSFLLPHSTGEFKNRPTAALQNAFEPDDKRVASSFNPVNGPLSVQRFILKYGTTNAFTEFDADYNFPVFRYADVYLLLAEALGESAEAYGLINALRTRAGLPAISAATAGTFEDKLLHERQVELAFEDHRWPDLLRFGKAAAVMQAQGKTPRLLFLIPRRELDINAPFTQNAR